MKKKKFESLDWELFIPLGYPTNPNGSVLSFVWDESIKILPNYEKHSRFFWLERLKRDVNNEK